MKFCFLFILFVAGCNSPAVEESITTNNKSIKVDLLFEKDGVRVYRFKDGGQAVYYVDSRGSVQWNENAGPDSVWTKRVVTE